MGHKKVDMEHLIIGFIYNIRYCISYHEHFNNLSTRRPTIYEPFKFRNKH